MRALLLSLSFALTGCTAVKATINVVAADQAVARAEDHQAPDLATYEYTMAIRFLEKAKEEAGYADYKAAEQLAKQAADWADQAIIAIERGGRDLDLDAAGDDLTDAPMLPSIPPDPPKPPPAPSAEDQEILDELDPTPGEDPVLPPADTDDEALDDAWQESP